MDVKSYANGEDRFRSGRSYEYRLVQNSPELAHIDNQGNCSKCGWTDTQVFLPVRPDYCVFCKQYVSSMCHGIKIHKCSKCVSH